MHWNFLLHTYYFMLDNIRNRLKMGRIGINNNNIFEKIRKQNLGTGREKQKHNNTIIQQVLCELCG